VSFVTWFAISVALTEFDVAVSNAACVVTGDGIVVNNERSLLNLSYYPSIFLEGLNSTTKTAKTFNVSVEIRAGHLSLLGILSTSFSTSLFITHHHPLI
jgi:hypothetical protein